MRGLLHGGGQPHSPLGELPAPLSAHAAASAERSYLKTMRNRGESGQPHPCASAPAAGLEPATVRLTVECSAIELRGIANTKTLAAAADRRQSRCGALHHRDLRRPAAALRFAHWKRRAVMSRRPFPFRELPCPFRTPPCPFRKLPCPFRTPPAPIREFPSRALSPSHRFRLRLQATPHLHSSPRARSSRDRPPTAVQRRLSENSRGRPPSFPHPRPPRASRFPRMRRATPQRQTASGSPAQARFPGPGRPLRATKGFPKPRRPPIPPGFPALARSPASPSFPARQAGPARPMRLRSSPAQTPRLKTRRRRPVQRLRRPLRARSPNRPLHSLPRLPPPRML